MSSQLSKDQSNRILSESLHLLLSGLGKVAADTFEKADEEFLKLADKAGASDKSRALMDARNEIKENKTSIENAFKKYLTKQFSKKLGIAEESDISSSVSSLTIMQLTLVDEKEVEESILISKMSNALQSECKEGLQNLTTRIGFLINATEFELKDNPFSPQIILEAFSHAADKVELGMTGKFAFMNIFDQQLSSKLPLIYKGINEKLISENILREIKPAYINRTKSSASTTYSSRPHAGNPSSTYASRPQGENQGYPSGNGSGSSIDSNQNPQEIFNLLQQLLTRSPGVSAQAPTQVPTQAISHPPGAPVAFNNAPIISAELLESLNQLQRGEVVLTPVLPDSGAGIASASVTSTIPVNVLHNIKASSSSSNIGQLDSVTIDVVAMLFDHIFDDPEIPETMKNLIGRLQIPVLKAAMMDKTFFSSKTNPARQFIDTLGKTVVNHGSKLEEEDPLYIEAQRVVQKILNEFESDIGLFSEVLNEFETFLENEEKKNDEIIELSAKLLHERELQAIAESIAEKAISERVKKSTAVEGISSFLENAWVKVLTKAYAENGEDSEQWKENIQVIDDLLWSIRSKKTIDDRKRLLGMLPELLRKLRQGTASISIDEAEEKEFFESLVSIHTQVIKLGVQPVNSRPALSSRPSKSQKVEQAAVEAPIITEEIAEVSEVESEKPVEEELLIKNSINQGNIEIEEIRLSNEDNQTNTSDAEDEFYWAPSSSLKRGQWVDIKQEDGQFLRYKLSWISPKKNVYLFTNNNNQKALSISQQALEKQLTEKIIRLVADVAPIDRAMESMLGHLQS